MRTNVGLASSSFPPSSSSVSHHRLFHLFRLLRELDFGEEDIGYWREAGGAEHISLEPL